MKLEYKNQENKYQTVKEVIKKEFSISERLFLKLKRNKKILVNNQVALPNQIIHSNDCIVVDLSFDEQSENIVPTQMDLDIVFEDDAMLIVNKSPNLPVHPSMAHFTDSLSNSIQYYFMQNKIKTKIRPVNRLDKDTSGLVIFAKNEYVQENLSRQMQQHVFQKSYQAILVGNLSKKSGTIDAPISRKNGSIIEREVNLNGQKSITHYHLIQNFKDDCLVEFQLETGRTHQIRVHCKYIGHPILGDTLYGTSSEFISRQALHAYKIEFFHPLTKEKVKFEIPLPEDMLFFYKNFLKKY